MTNPFTHMAMGSAMFILQLSALPDSVCDL